MIRDWRAKWKAGTDGATGEHFPFGWAQLNSDGLASNFEYNNPKADLSGKYGEFGEWGPGNSNRTCARANHRSLVDSARNCFSRVLLVAHSIPEEEKENDRCVQLYSTPLH
jgi:hypothetical protein